MPGTEGNGGYQAQSGGGDTGGLPGTDPGGGGYQAVLDILTSEYGAVITHDRRLGVDVVAFPEAEDPIALFFNAIVNHTYEGKPLYYYIGFIEVPSVGSYDLDVQAAKAVGSLPAPDDTYFLNQWNLGITHLFDAQWHPAGAKSQVTIGVIDSGISPMLRQHGGLDGADIEHAEVRVGDTVIDAGLDVPFSHALGVISLLGDQNQDGDGIVSFVGGWEEDGCAITGSSFFESNAPIIRSYGVGVLGPISTAVAAAIHDAIADEVDVINLGLAIGYSPLVEEAIREAIDAGIVVVAAAGNYSGGAGQREALFPASVEGVISVGSVNRRGQLSQFSARHGVDLLAPGEQIIVGGPNDLWYEGYGTSYAAPHVTAAAAMLKAVNPTLTASDVQEILQDRASRHDRSTPGILNAFGALNQALPAHERAPFAMTPLACSVQALLSDLTSDRGYGGAGKNGESSPWWDQFAYDASADAELYAALEQSAEELPAQIGLEGNYPNPFNPSTTIRFSVANEQNVTLAVYNALGQQVEVLISGQVEAGRHDASFDASHLPSGIYLARLQTETGSFTQKMILAK